VPKSYIRTKIDRACNDLMDELNAAGVKTSGVGHDSPQNTKIIVYLVRKADIGKVPKEFAGYPVETHHTGTFRAG